MSRVKSRQIIRLANGDAMSVGEALDQGRVALYSPQREYNRKTGELKKLPRRYVCEDDALWPIGEKLYQSRLEKTK